KATNPPPTKDPLPSNKAQSNMPPSRTWIWFLLLLIFNYFLMSTFFPSPTDPVVIPYTLFKEEVSKGNVKSIYSKGETITGQFDESVVYPAAELEEGTQPSKE